MQSLLQIIVLNPARLVPPKERLKPGQAQFEVQDAECLLLNDDGTPKQVGVLDIRQELRGVARVGVFMGSFAMEVGWKDRKIGAVLTGLQEVELTPKGPVTKAPAKVTS